ncbi:YdcF family protein [Candidatus Berkelbacteria bacterium]|nr:YdcF family protein [Candidatus Berkelbacteria bacterium]
MKEAPKKIVVVCGYGCHLTPEVTYYLEQVVGYLQTHWGILVITTGGFTDPRRAPGVSEAAMMRRYIAQRLLGLKIKEHVFGRHILCEEMALTTLDNLRYSREILKEWPGVPVTIFCDSIRRFKIGFLANRIFRHWAMKIIGVDFKRSFKEKIRQYLIATPLEILCYYFSGLDHFFLARRKRKWGIPP